MVSWTDCQGVQSFLPVGSAIVRDDEIFSHPANGRRTGQLWIGDWIPMDGSWGVPRCLSPIIYSKPGTVCGRGLVSLHYLWVNQGASKDSTVQGWELKLHWFFVSALTISDIPICFIRWGSYSIRIKLGVFLAYVCSVFRPTTVVFSGRIIENYWHLFQGSMLGEFHHQKADWLSGVEFHKSQYAKM